MDPQLLAMLFKGLFGGMGGGGTGPGALPQTPVPFGVPSAGMPTEGMPAAPMPPPMDTTTGMPTGAPTMPTPPMMPGGGGVPYGGESQTMTSLGEALMPKPAPGVPTPMARPANLGEPSGGDGTPGFYGGSPETNPNLKPITGAGGQQQRSPADIQKMLSGVKMPQGPDVVKPSTPAAPQTRAAGNSNLMELLSMLGMGSKTLRGPTTLGQALENRPAMWGGAYG